MRDNHVRSNACWRCNSIGHFDKNCTTTPLSLDGHREDKFTSDTSPTINHMSHTLMAPTLITYFTFRKILKKLVRSAISNHTGTKARPTVLKGTTHYATGSATQKAAPTVTAAAGTVNTTVAF